MGVGIGLPLARSLATLHKGRLIGYRTPENTLFDHSLNKRSKAANREGSGAKYRSIGMR